MSSPFSRTMRSLHADSFRPALISLVVAIILLVIWGTWFFFAQMTFYENSQSAYLTDGEIILAEFPAEAFNRIQTGQAARLHLDGAMGKQVGTIRAIVTDVMRPSQAEKTGEVRLFAFANADSPIRFQEKLTGQVEIAVEQISPAQLVMRVSGLF
ncbi:MAG: hypothetical protein DRR00_09350 [Candidatus Parabeggiatoa sp. nov. 3]|nr:MAG: hypothetical protein DRR00_09350 [Gammaproteobacteria bacterium]RKZ63158.1 MAG: hypothetical protein DRQ99_17545 [Gammaproteobacteria bacterium]